MPNAGQVLQSSWPHFLAFIPPFLGIFSAELRLVPNLAIRRPLGARDVATPHHVADVHLSLFSMFSAELSFAPNCAVRWPLDAFDEEGTSLLYGVHHPVLGVFGAELRLAPNRAARHPRLAMLMRAPLRRRTVLFVDTLFSLGGNLSQVEPALAGP